MKLIEILRKILLREVNDIVQIERLKDIGITYDIKEDKEDFFLVIITSEKFDEPFALSIKGSNHYAVMGPWDGNKIDFETNFNQPENLMSMRKAIFSFLRYYLDKFNIDHFEFAVLESGRSEIYEHFLSKSFSDYEMTKYSIGKISSFKMDKKHA